ncbi:MAG: DUF2161 family putative PD-(D/E)XK-type phosphodiesterase, partial [Pseudomonadota bacterium]
PVKQYLELQGYRVKGEVGNCDVLAVRGDESVVVELKLTFNLNVLLQAVDRLALTDGVYIGVPHNCNALRKRQKLVLKTLRMLGLGLLTINLNRGSQTVTAVLDPGPYSPRKSHHRQSRLLGEFEKRVSDPNFGGSDRRSGVVTAYRQRALNIASLLQQSGPSKASDVAKTIDAPDARNILYRDVYGWFERVAYGVYGLSPRGERELKEWIKPDTDES